MENDGVDPIFSPGFNQGTLTEEQIDRLTVEQREQ
jgi:hypothetical protein